MKRYVASVLACVAVVAVALIALGAVSLAVPQRAAAWVHEAGSFNAPNSVVGYVDGPGGEEDWWSVYLEAGNTYHVWTSYYGTPTLDDSVLIVQDPYGTQVGYSDDSNGTQWSDVTLTNVSYTGWYRMRVTAFAPDHYGYYWLNVGLTNRPPTGTGENYYGTEDTAMYQSATYGVLANDYDPDGYSQMQASHYSGPSHGSLTLYSDGSFWYTPSANYFGWDSFQYRVYDGYTYSSPITVNVYSAPVQDAPVAGNDGWYYATEDSTYNGTGLMSNDVDYDGQPITAHYYDGPSHGSVTVRADGSFVYTPSPNYYGNDSFRYRVADSIEYSNIATVYINVADVPDPPVGVSDSYEATEDVEFTLPASGVLSNDTDVDNRPLTAQIVTQPLHGEVTLNANGSLTYLGDQNYNGTDSFTYRPVDEGQAGSVATVTFSIAAVNDVPTPVSDAATVTEDEYVYVAAEEGLLANDPSDVEGDPIATTLWSAPEYGELILNEDGSFLYTPDPDYFGVDEFWYRIWDGTDYSPPGKVTLTVIGTPDAPVSVADSYETNEDTTLTRNEGGGVLVNDYDVDRDVLTALLVTEPEHGTLTLRGNGNFTYVPDENWYGTDTFEYNPYDGALHGITQTVTITVNSVNDPPVAGDEAYSTDEDVKLEVTSGGVLSNDSDPVEGSPVTASLVTDVAHGTLALGSDGLFTYTPAANYHGSDSFKYKAYDGESYSATATVSLTVNSVNDTPTAAADSYSTDEDTQLSVGGSGVLGNDSDVDGDSISASLVDDVAHGTLSLQSNGRFTYTPTANYHGSDSFTYRAYDGALYADKVTVSLTLNSVNDTATVGADSYATDEDTTLTVEAPGVLGNDADVDGDTLTPTSTRSPSHGALTLNTDGSLRYVPDANYHGSDSFDYKVSDGHADSATTTVSLTINSVNDPPSAADDLGYTTSEDTTLVATTVLANDSDVENDPMTAVLLGDGPSHGTLTLRSNGTFDYAPNANWYGTDEFTYRAYDGAAYSSSATVRVTVSSVNDKPVAADDALSVDEDDVLGIGSPGILGNDSDPVEGSPISASLVSDVSHGTLSLRADGGLSYRPTANFHGTDRFVYRAHDGTDYSDNATVTITVNSVNDPPVGVADSYSTDEDVAIERSAPGVLSNDTDADGDTLTVRLHQSPSNGTLTFNSDGSFRYAPNAGWSGSDSFSYEAHDGTVYTDPVTVSITVRNVYDPPVAIEDTITTYEDQTLNMAAPAILSNDLGDGPIAVNAWRDSSHGTSGTVTLWASGRLKYVPPANFNGTDHFQYRISDPTTRSAYATVTVNVLPVNDPPVASADTTSVTEDTPKRLRVTANDTDVDGDTLYADVVTDPSHGTVVEEDDGSLTYSPAENYHGADSFTYRAYDGTVYSEAVTVSIDVTSVYDNPVGVEDSASTDEDTGLSVVAPGVLGNDPDPIETSTKRSVLETTTAHGILSLQQDGSYTYLPSANFSGTDRFWYRVSDGEVTSAPTTVTITVNSVNDAPSATGDSYLATEDTRLSVVAPGVLSNDTDVEGSTLTADLVTDAGHGTLDIESDGSFVYDPDENYNGTDTFAYRAYDGTDYSGSVTVTLTVGAVNDPPTGRPSRSFDATEDVQLSVGASDGVLQGASDVDSDTITASLVTDVEHGTLSLSSDGSFTYAAAANWFGTDHFHFRVYDGTAYSELCTAMIDVASVNDPPVATGESYSTDEDVQLSVTGDGVLGNDSDPVEHDSLSAHLVTDVSHGTLSLQSNGRFSYTPSANWNGTDSFTYKASDGTDYSNTVTVEITVRAVNDPPTGRPSRSYDATEDVQLSVGASDGVLEGASDVESDTITAVLLTDVEHGTLSLNSDGSFTYAAAANWFGTDHFHYRVYDGVAYSESLVANIDVASVNDLPTATADSYSTDEDVQLSVNVATGVLANDDDPVEHSALTAHLVTDVAHGTLSLGSDGHFTYTPAANWHGTDSFTYKNSDGTDYSNTVTVQITVNSVNDAPRAVADTASTAEDTQLSVAAPGVLGNDTDVDGDTLTAELVSDVSHGTLSLSSNGAYTYTPAENYNGTDSFTYRADDGTTHSSTVTVTITVTSVNDPVVAVADSATTAEDTQLSVAAPGVLGNDTDIDGDTLTASLYSNVSHGTLTLRSNGSYTYTPAANYNGTDSFRYRAYDGTEYSSPVTVSLTITAVNDAPVGVADTAVVAQEHSLSVAAPGVLGNDTDAEGDPLSASVVTNPAHGTLSLNANGSYTYTPTSGYSGPDSFVYRSYDGVAYSANTLVSITVSARPATTLAISTSAVTCTYTVGATIRGTLSSPSGPVSGQTVTLQSSLDALTWAPVGTDVSDGSGVVAWAVDPDRHTYYRLIYTTTPDYTGTTSATIKQLVYALPGVPQGYATWKRGVEYSVWGTLQPTHSASSALVKLYLWRYEGGVWKAYGYKTCTTSAYLSYSKYTSAKFALTLTGKWKLKAYVGCTDVHSPAWSEEKIITVQ